MAVSDLDLDALFAITQVLVNAHSEVAIGICRGCVRFSTHGHFHLGTCLGLANDGGLFVAGDAIQGTGPCVVDGNRIQTGTGAGRRCGVTRNWHTLFGWVVERITCEHLVGRAGRDGWLNQNVVCAIGVHCGRSDRTIGAVHINRHTSLKTLLGNATFDFRACRLIRAVELIDHFSHDWRHRWNHVASDASGGRHVVGSIARRHCVDSTFFQSWSDDNLITAVGINSHAVDDLAAGSWCAHQHHTVGFRTACEGGGLQHTFGVVVACFVNKGGCWSRGVSASASTTAACCCGSTGCTQTCQQGIEAQHTHSRARSHGGLTQHVGDGLLTGEGRHLSAITGELRRVVVQQTVFGLPHNRWTIGHVVVVLDHEVKRCLVGINDIDVQVFTNATRLDHIGCHAGLGIDQLILALWRGLQTKHFARFKGVHLLAAIGKCDFDVVLLAHDFSSLNLLFCMDQCLLT